MSRYDLYAFSPDGRVITGWRMFEVADDAAAILLASDCLWHTAELWSDDRLVRRWGDAAVSQPAFAAQHIAC